MSGDDDLPILAELEEEFSRMVAEALRPRAAAIAAGPASAPVRRRPDRRATGLRTGRRILRRAAVAGALVGVVGATALATKSVVQRGTSSTAPTVLRRAPAFELAVRRFHGRLCLDVTYAAGVASRCGATPPASGVAPLSAMAPDRRYVAGLTGGAVRRVRVRANGQTLEAATHAVGDAAATRRSELPADLRWFVAAVRPQVGRPATAAHIVALGRTGAALGPATIDCSGAGAGAGACDTSPGG